MTHSMILYGLIVLRTNKGGLKNMCEVLDRAEARGELKGAVRAYLDVKVPIEEIAKKLNISVEEVQKIADTL